MSGSRVVTAAEMREMDRVTIEDAGVAGVVLMETAGRATAEIARELADDDAGPIVILCGRGNNGGDGFVVARTMQQWGYEVLCLLASRREAVSGEALTQLDIADTLGVSIIETEGGLDEDAEMALASAGLVVDALLGTGLSSDVGGVMSELIDIVNDMEVPVLGVDVPSGICADTGRVLGCAMVCDVTVTFGCLKRGLTVYPGAGFAGDVIVADIGIPTDVMDHVAPAASLNDDLHPPYVPTRHAAVHKGLCGHVLVVGGAPGKSGAVLLAGMAALRSGAGLVTVLTDARCQAALEGRYPELMIEAGWTADSLGDIDAILDGKDAIVVGPGLPTSAVGRSVLAEVCVRGTPVVIDAGALTLLAERPELLADAAAVLTPHPGEAGRLLGTDGATVQRDRFAALAGLVEASRRVVVLKGARTLVGAPDGRIWINTTGNAGMATAGTGDVLAGIIGALLARGMRPAEAARVGVCIHGHAGDVAAAARGQESLIASDVIDGLASVLREPKEADLEEA